MKYKTNELNLQQTQLKYSPGKVDVYVQLNNFHAGTIDLVNKTFTSSSRSFKNVFKLFGGGLGLNNELLFSVLPYYSIETIIIPFEGRILQTTTSKWKSIGVISPYGGANVDKQVILAINEINMEDSDRYVNKVSLTNPDYQLSLIFQV